MTSYPRVSLWVAMFLVSWPPRIASAQEDVVEPIWTLSQAPGIVQEAFDLRANYSLTEATVHYTIDGSAPSLDSPLWPGRYRAEATIMLRWIAVVDEVIVARKGAGYLFADAGGAALAWRASMQITGNPNPVSSCHNQVAVGPVSRPIRLACAAFDLLYCMQLSSILRQLHVDRYKPTYVLST